MIFNSYTYLLLFLPLALIGFFFAARIAVRAAFVWLVIASIVYYGWWNPDPSQPWKPWYVLLILGSCLFNFWIGEYLARHRGTSRGKTLLISGVSANLILLAYFKYTGFVGRLIEQLGDFSFHLPNVVLALGISFFTFQQIAYLVDAWRGETEEYRFTDYLLFVSFWPQLIAGPIVHHKEMLPQFEKQTWKNHRWVDTSAGLTILIIGLFKKVVIADNVAPVANAIFEMAGGTGRPPGFLEAWAGAIAYGIQIYFDFSGYTDMAIGSARLFGIRLPLNFHSPYKAVSIVDFWRRWHITLSRFLRDYLYIPLGGNRKGKSRRYVNLLITMVLGGFWHGAGWTYLLWGLLHGVFLCVNHGWIFLRKKRGLPKVPKPMAIAITFLLVIIAWVPFRAGTFELGSSGSTTKALAATREMLAAMFGFHGLGGWPDVATQVVKESHALRACLLVFVCWFVPNTQQFMRRYQPAMDPSHFEDYQIGPRKWWQWRPNSRWFAFTLLLMLATLYQFDKLSEFIYFQF
ncbi:D-alanyl-lipoteichoic acid acyltransferase DltB (MBOAT superfamily) [Haloferula luteola]|uniref:D-alanyl-lipoteichoic acid acyltransferase DltB (MBOAT superfamily) n=1 Tax=Haloferula luteola TaxID=595692 RepID=A0A840VIV9_9BACT|nr:MBOAT family protein [Haloferula luteola]MBB5352641.1 D-alanyl-lipoteichoic acid acyltransferase DltB (MBOAT superfamily) [Haloferula luteola]